MTGVTSRDPSSSPNIPSSSVAARVIPPEGLEKIIPIQEEFRALTQEPLFREASYQGKRISKDPQAISWTVSKIGALLGTIYNSHVTTSDDRNKVKSLTIEIKEHKKNLAAHNKREQNYYNTCFALAKHALAELTHLRTSLERSYSTQDKWNGAINELADCTLAPLFLGESLLGTPFIEKGIAAAERMQKKIDKLPEKSAARTCLESVRDQLASEFLEGIKEWSEVLEDSINEETQLLFDLLDNAESQGLPTEDLKRQLVALQEQQDDLKQTLYQIARTKANSLPALEPLLTDIIKTIQQGGVELDSRLDQYKDLSSLLPLEYGKTAWKELVAKRPEKEITLFERFKEALFSPETWSESKKTAVRTLLLGMRMIQRGVGIHAKYAQAATLPEKALRMQEKIAPDIQQAINRDTGRLGILLNDKYISLSHHPQLIDKFAKGNEPLRQALIESLEKFGNQKPTRDELFQVMDAFKMSQYAANQPTLFPHLSFGDWCALFTKTELPSIQEETNSLEGDAVPPSQDYAVTVRPADNDLPWVKGVINSVGTMLGWTQESQQVSALPEFISTKAGEGELQLQTALRGLSEQEHRILQDRKNESAGELGQELALLQREITKTLQNKPEARCLLSTLALWTQEVSDKCYAVKLFEERMKANLKEG